MTWIPNFVIRRAGEYAFEMWMRVCKRTFVQKTKQKSARSFRKHTFKFQDFKFRIFELHGSASILEYRKNIKLRRKRSRMKDTGKSSCRKLRRVVYYLLYRMDAQKTHYKISFSAKISKIENSDFFSIYFPPNSRSTALKGGYLCYSWALRAKE